MVIAWERQAVLVETALESIRPGLARWLYLWSDLGHILYLLKASAFSSVKWD